MKILKIFGILAILISCILLFSSCGNESPKYYHGLEYYSRKDIKTLPLMAIEDNSSTDSQGYFLICFGEYSSNKVIKYRALVKFPDNTMKLIDFKPENIFIKYGNKCSITASLWGFLENMWYSPFTEEVIIEIPKEYIKFENIIDGK